MKFKKQSLIKCFIFSLLFCGLCYFIMFNTNEYRSFFVVIETISAIFAVTSFDKYQDLTYEEIGKKRNLVSKYSYVFMIVADVIVLRVFIGAEYAVIRTCVLIIFLFLLFLIMMIAQSVRKQN